MQIPRRRADLFKKREDGPVYLTEAGLKQLQNRLAEIKQELPELISESTRQADYGDRSDNAAYKEAKSALRRAHGQVLSIEDQLKRVVIIPLTPNTTGRVQLGSTVILETEKGEKTFQILGPRETDPDKGRISNQSPLGSALMNHIEGDTIFIPTSNGIKTYRILKIS